MQDDSSFNLIDLEIMYKLSIMLRCNLIIFTALILSTATVTAQECVFRRTGYMVKDPDYRAPQIHIFYQAEPQRDTNLTLFRLKKKAKVSMELAEKISVDEKKKTMRIELKRSCGWSDGTTVNAHHMLKGIQLYFEQTEHPQVFFDFFKNAKAILNDRADSSVLGVRVINDFTLEFDLLSPPELLMQVLSYPVFTPAPLHLLAKDPNNWPVKSIVRVSSGAYRAVSYETEKKIELVRNRFFCKDIPVNFDRVEFMARKKHKTFIKEMIMDKVDTISEVDKAQVLYQIENNPQTSGFTLGSYEEDRTISLLINSNNTVLHNKKVRQAIYLVLNHELMNRVLSPKGKSYISMGISPQYPGYKKIELSDDLEPMDQRFEKAKRLMELLGYGPNNRLKLRFLGFQDDLSSKVLLVISSQLSQIYIDTEIKVDNRSQYWDHMKKGNYDLLLTGWTADFHDPSNFLKGSLAQLKLPAQLSKEYTEQLNKTYSIFNSKVRMNELAKIERSMLESFYIIPLYRYQNHYLLRPGFKLLDEPVLSARNMINENCRSFQSESIN